MPLRLELCLPRRAPCESCRLGYDAAGVFVISVKVIALTHQNTEPPTCLSFASHVGTAHCDQPEIKIVIENRIRLHLVAGQPSQSGLLLLLGEKDHQYGCRPS